MSARKGRPESRPPEETDPYVSPPSVPAPGLVTPKLYRRHYCRRQHRSYLTAARCIWPRAEWVCGDGQYASLAWCSVLTIALYDTLADAEAAQRFIGKYGCGGRCGGPPWHEIVGLAPELVGARGRWSR